MAKQIPASLATNNTPIPSMALATIHTTPNANDGTNRTNCARIDPRPFYMMREPVSGPDFFSVKKSPLTHALEALTKAFAPLHLIVSNDKLN